MRNFEDFKREVERHILVFMPEDYQNVEIEIKEINKNNGVKLDALVIQKEGQTIIPNVYLQDYYKEYLDGAAMEEMMMKISRNYLNALQELPIPKLYGMEFEKIKDNIIFTVINTKMNEELLNKVPHIGKQDLSMVFRWLVNQDENGMASALLHNEHMNEWGLTNEQLFEIAVKNTEEKFPVSFRNMGDVIMEIMGKDMEGMFPGMDLSEEEAFEMLGPNEGPAMYVLSNQSNMNGAAAMFYPDSLQNIAEKLGSNFYILPSSIHELILVPETDRIGVAALADMVQDVNATQVPEGELLSGSIYFYDKEQQEISIVGGNEMEKSQGNSYALEEEEEYELEM